MRIGLMLRHEGRQPGGTGTYTDMIVRNMLALNRHHDYFLFYNSRWQLDAFPEVRGVTAVAVRSPSKFLWDQFLVPWLAWKHRLDVLFNPKLSVPLLAPCPTVFVQHGADWLVVPEQYPLLDRLYFTPFVRLYWWKADRIISVSNDTERRLAAFMGDKCAKKLQTIHHGVDGERFQPVDEVEASERLRDKYGLEGPFILYLGQIYKMKNVGNLIRAFAKLRGRIPHKLVLVGKPGPKSGPDLKLIDTLGVRDLVVQTGSVSDEDAPLFYNAADLFAFPSIYEGFGLPIIEAMAAGCPVITSTLGACPEVAGDAAMLVDPYDVEAISTAILQVVSDTALRDDLRRRGLQRAQNFSWEQSAEQTVKLLESVVLEHHAIRGSHEMSSQGP